MEIKSCNGACVTAIAKNTIDQKRKRRSIRLQGYHYSQAGAYYITMYTRNRECLFGNVVDGQIQLNEVGRIVQTVWNGLPQFYEGVRIRCVHCHAQSRAWDGGDSGRGRGDS